MREYVPDYGLLAFTDEDTKNSPLETWMMVRKLQEPSNTEL